jgi:outer membrane protein TolC
MILGAGSSGQTMAQTSLTVADVRQRAASFNRQYLSAQQDLKQAGSRVRTARAGVFPDVNFSSSYNRNFIIPSFFVTADGETMEFRTGFKNNFGYTLSVTQPIWEGGKAITAWQIARLYRDYSQFNLDAVESEVLYNADLLFYNAIFQRSVLETALKAHEATSYNLQVVEKQYQQGVVSEFELLRARVENANLEPQILQAESEVVLAKKRLKSFIGMPLRDSIVLVESALDTSLTELPQLESMVTLALERRSETKASRKLTSITKKAISIAKAEYWPTLDGSYTYNRSSSSDIWTLDQNVSKSSTIGLSLNFKIFDGFERSGEVAYRRADHEKTRIAEDQLVDDVRLEVEQAYDQLVRAKKSLDIQKETIAQAEEGLKIANLRYEQGVGTQLEVLAAQSALTNARNSLAQALFFFRTSKAQLRKATTIEIGEETR